jgi:hypothetical protein
MTTRRTLAVLALSALLAVPAAASAQTRRSAPPPSRSGATSSTPTSFGSTWRFSGLAGFDFAEGETGFGLRGDAETDIERLAPNVMLGGVGSLGFTHYGKSESAFGMSVDTSTNIFKLVPAARFTFDLAPQFQAYGDAGLGLYFYSNSVETSVPGFGSTSASSSGAGATMRFAVGGLYAVNDKVSIGAEFGANPFFGDVDTTIWNLMAQVSFR